MTNSRPWLAAFGATILALFGACQKVNHERILGEDRFANNLVMWSVNGKYRDVMYIAVPGKEKPLPDNYLQFNDGVVVRLHEVTEDFLLKRNDTTHKHIDPEDEELYRCPAEVVFKDGRITQFDISAGTNLEIGPTANGPLVKLPCPEERFIEVFGKPVNKTAIKPHAP